GDLLEQLGVRDGAAVARLPLPVVGDPVAPPGGHVTVEAVEADVEPPPDEPLGEREVPLADGAPLLVPVERFGLACPEPLPVGVGLGGEGAVADQGVPLGL